MFGKNRQYITKAFGVLAVLMILSLIFSYFIYLV